MTAKVESVFQVLLEGGSFTPESALEWLAGDGEELAHLVLSISDQVDDPADRRALRWVGSEELFLRDSALDAIKFGKPEAVDWSEGEVKTAVDHLSRVLALRSRFDSDMDMYGRGFNVVADVLARILRAKAERSAPAPGSPGSGRSADDSDEELVDEAPTEERTRPSLWVVNQTAHLHGDDIEPPVPEVESDDLVCQTYSDPDSEAQIRVYPEPHTLTALLEDIPLERIPWLVAALLEIASRCEIPVKCTPVVVHRSRLVPCDPPGGAEVTA